MDSENRLGEYLRARRDLARHEDSEGDRAPEDGFAAYLRKALDELRAASAQLG